MMLTPRDRKLIERVGQYGVLSTEQVAKMFFGDVAITTVRRRLRALEQDHHILRVQGLDGGAVGWALTKKAAQTSALPYLARRLNRNTLKHDVTLSEVRYVLERAGVAHQWVSEYVLKTQSMRQQTHSRTSESFVPDALFSVRQKAESRVVALELELNPKHKKRYENILTRYRRKSTLWAVWYLVPSETLGLTIQNVWREINAGKRNDLLIWSKLDDLLRDPWNTKVYSAHFTHYLRELVAMKRPAPLGAPPESRQNYGVIAQHNPLPIENHK